MAEHEGRPSFMGIVGAGADPRGEGGHRDYSRGIICNNTKGI